MFPYLLSNEHVIKTKIPYGIRNDMLALPSLSVSTSILFITERLHFNRNMFNNRCQLRFCSLYIQGYINPAFA